MERSASAPWPISRRLVAAGAAGFADGEGREVVVQDEALAGLAAGVAVEHPALRRSDARVARARACVSPRWKRAEPWERGSRPTSALSWRMVSRSRPSQRVLLVEDGDAEGFLLQVVEGLADLELAWPRGISRVMAAVTSSLRALDRFAAGDFARGVEGGFDAVAGDGVGDFEEFVLHVEERDFALWLCRPWRRVRSARR